MKIRKGTAKDIPNLLKLYHGVKEISPFDGGGYSKGYFLEFLKSNNKIVLVAEENKKIVGALNAEIEKLAKYVFVNAIVVSSKEKKKGIGKMLFRSLEAIGRKIGIKDMMHLVYDWNIKMQKVSKKLGYKKGHKLILYHKKI